MGLTLVTKFVEVDVVFIFTFPLMCLKMSVYSNPNVPVVQNKITLFKNIHKAIAAPFELPVTILLVCGSRANMTLF